jgi:hypothetical protein
MQPLLKWARSAVADWDLLNWLTAIASLIVIGGVLYGIIKLIWGYFQRRRAAQQRERNALRSLLKWLWSHRVLDEPLYNEDPVGALESVREIRPCLFSYKLEHTAMNSR